MEAFNLKCKMEMQYVKCISVFKLTFSHTYVQYLVQNEN